MTKHRAPLTIDAALARVAGQIPGGWGQMAEICDRSTGLVRAWGDPDRREEIPLTDAITLDLAFRAEGGEGAPLFETYAHQLNEAGALRFSDEVALGRHAAETIRECGEANAALVAAAQPGADERARREAFREVEEAIDFLNRALPMLRGAAAFDGLLPGTEAVLHQATGPP